MFQGGEDEKPLEKYGRRRNASTSTKTQEKCDLRKNEIAFVCERVVELVFHLFWLICSTDSERKQKMFFVSEGRFSQHLRH